MMNKINLNGRTGTDKNKRLYKTLRVFNELALGTEFGVNGNEGNGGRKGTFVRQTCNYL
jgi:hypothetical protein